MVDVTVLLPVYNGEEYLRETMVSILSQTYKEFEFLIVDDGSTDGTFDIIKSFNDPRIRVLKNPERLKLSGALNRGINEAKGKYIARMDGDDIAFPNRLEKQFLFLEEHPEIGVCGTGIRIFGINVQERNDIYPADHKAIKSYSLFDCPFCHPTVMMRKQMFEQYQLYYDGSFYPTEDFELWTRAVNRFPTANLSEVLLRYRVHDKSMTGADWDEMDKQAARAIEPLLKDMGAVCSMEEVQFHRNIGRGRSCALENLQQVDRAERWLKYLFELNKDKRVYDEKALLSMLSTVWFRLNVNSSGLGFPLLKKYMLSKFGRISQEPMRFATLVGSVIKRKTRILSSASS